jgi:hypothetical protein
MIDVSGHQAIKQWKMNPRNRLPCCSKSSGRAIARSSTTIIHFIMRFKRSCTGFWLTRLSVPVFGYRLRRRRLPVGSDPSALALYVVAALRGIGAGAAQHWDIGFCWKGDDGLGLLSAGSLVVPIILTSPVLSCLGFLDDPTAACVGMAERWAS